MLCVHAGEVFALGHLNPDHDREYPGEAAIKEEVFNVCVGEPFVEYVGTSYEESELDAFLLYTLKRGWTSERGEYTCVVVTANGDPLTASVRGTGR